MRIDRFIAAMIGSLMALAAAQARAQVSDDVVRIGVMNDHLQNLPIPDLANAGKSG